MKQTFVIAFLFFTACLQENDPMGLPTSRDVTFTPNSPVPSTVLNNIQDSIVAEHSRLGGGGYGPITLTDAPTAPDYHFTTPRTRKIPALAGANDSTFTDWATIGGHVEATVAGAHAWKIPIPVEDGETISMTMRVAHGSASADAIQIQLVRENPSVQTLVATVHSAALTSVQSITVVTGHAVAAGDWYYLIVLPGAASGAMNRDLYDVQISATR